MAEVPKLLYIVVVDDGGEEGKKSSSFRYTRPVLQSTLQLMGCKARHASKVCLFLWEPGAAGLVVDHGPPFLALLSPLGFFVTMFFKSMVPINDFSRA